MMLTKEFYRKVVNACLPELRKNIKRLDYKLEHDNRNKRVEIPYSNMDSMSITAQAHEFDRIFDIVGKLDEMSGNVIKLKLLGYKGKEIEGLLRITARKVSYSIEKARKIARLDCKKQP